MYLPVVFRQGKALVLTQRRSGLPGDIWQCLKTFLVVTNRDRVLWDSSEYRPGMLLHILQYITQLPQQRIKRLKISEPRLRNPREQRRRAQNEVGGRDDEQILEGM